MTDEDEQRLNQKLSTVHTSFLNHKADARAIAHFEGLIAQALGELRHEGVPLPKGTPIAFCGRSTRGHGSEMQSFIVWHDGPHVPLDQGDRGVEPAREDDADFHDYLGTVYDSNGNKPVDLWLCRHNARMPVCSAHYIDNNPMSAPLDGLIDLIGKSNRTFEELCGGPIALMCAARLAVRLVCN